jgi:hypothetical protein
VVVEVLEVVVLVKELVELEVIELLVMDQVLYKVQY